MKHKILIEKGSSLHKLICEAYIESNKFCFTKSSRQSRDKRVLELLGKIEVIIAATYAKEFKWNKWDYNYEKCSLRDFLDHNVSIFVHGVYEK